MKIKELRKENKITQSKMAMDLDLSQNTISQYENGKREPDIKTLKRIADYFNVSIDYLVEREEYSKINNYKHLSLR